jgi:hypothetical protein
MKEDNLPLEDYSEQPQPGAGYEDMTEEEYPLEDYPEEENKQEENNQED